MSRPRVGCGLGCLGCSVPLLAALAALVAVLVLAGCGSSTTAHKVKPKTSDTTSALFQKSVKDGAATGQTILVPNASVSEVIANCGVARLENMPVGDIASAWMTGCESTALADH